MTWTTERKIALGVMLTIASVFVALLAGSAMQLAYLQHNLGQTSGTYKVNVALSIVTGTVMTVLLLMGLVLTAGIARRGGET